MISQKIDKFLETRAARKDKLAELMELLKDLDPPEFQKVLNMAARQRPWRPTRKGWANILDQCLHAVYGALLLSPVLLLHTWIGAAIMGLLAGGIREVEQYFNQDLKIKMIWDRVLDVSAFVAGAILIFYIFG